MHGLLIYFSKEHAHRASFLSLQVGCERFDASFTGPKDA